MINDVFIFIKIFLVNYNKQTENVAGSDQLNWISNKIQTQN